MKLASKSSTEALSTKMKLKYLIPMETAYHGWTISPKSDCELLRTHRRNGDFCIKAHKVNGGGKR